MHPFIWILTCAVVFTRPVQAEFLTRPFENFYEHHRRISLTATPKYLTSTENYSAGSTAVKPSGLTQYSRTDLDALARFGIAERFSIFARMTWSRVSVTQTSVTQTTVAQSTLTGARFGFQDQSVGATYRLYKPQTPSKQMPFTVDAQFQADFPLYSAGGTTSSLAGTPALGDASKDFTLGIFGNLSLAPASRDIWLIQAGSGVTFRTDSFSRAVPWSIFLHHVPVPEGFRFQAGFFGIVSNKTDANLPGNSFRPTAGTSGSFFTNAVNPSLAIAKLALGYQIKGGTSILFGTQQPVWGQSAPKYMQFFASLQMPLTDSSGDRSRQSPEAYGASNKGFVDYSFEAKVTRMNDRLNLIKIDKGSDQSVAVGDVFDVFQVKTNEAVARATCTSVKPNEAALTITEYYKEIWIEEGFVARRPTQ